jgi:hypothetical protein
MDIKSELGRIGSFFEGLLVHLPPEAQPQGAQAVADLKGLAETGVTAGATALAGPLLGPEIAAVVDEALGTYADKIVSDAQAKAAAATAARATIASASAPPAA